MRGNASCKPDFQRTKASHGTELALFLANASDASLAAVTLETLERRHGGKGGMSSRDIECRLAEARAFRAALRGIV